MNSREFQQLSKYDQIKVIKEHGVFLADKVDAGNRLFLYAINTFYVELIHELSHINGRGCMITRVIDDIQQLDSYQEKANATHLLCSTR